jgi:hypothetical protein
MACDFRLSAPGLCGWAVLAIPEGTRVRAYQPNVLYVAKSQIGIRSPLTNEGTAADVVAPAT